MCGAAGQSRIEQKRETARQKVRLTPDGCYHHAGVLVAISMLARTLRFNKYAGRELRPEKEMSDGQDTQDTGGCEINWPLEDYDLAARSERGLPCAAEAGESWHSLDWLA